MEGNEPDWKTRCGVLEQQLARFREQAAKVREVISLKVKDLEQKVENSEVRATKSENKVKDLEDKVESNEVEAVNAKQQIKLLEAKLQEKERVICNLTSDLESERQERIQHAQQVESKATSIREWVQKKMRESDTESSQMRLENEHMKRENVNLREANHQAHVLLNELKEKLSFSQDQILRLSEELSNNERSGSPEYQILEPPDKDNNDNANKLENDDSNLPEHCQSPKSVNGNFPTSPTSLELPASPMSTTGDEHLDNHDSQFGNLDNQLDNHDSQFGNLDNQLDNHDNGNCKASNQLEDIDNTDKSGKENSETAIKRSSSGKSPSKIPRYIGQSGKPVQQSHSGKVSYYMSLKRGNDSDGDKAKFYIQVHDLENSSPYMKLVREDSNTTIDSERDSTSDLYASPFQTSRNSEIFPEENQRSVLNSVSSLSSDPSALDVNSLYAALVRPIQSKWKSSNNASESPQSPPPPPPPPRFLENIDHPPPAPPTPKSVNSPKDVIRTEGQFTSYLPSDLSLSDADSTAPSLPSWVLSDSVTSLGTDSPPYATLESTKDLMLKDPACPVYATLKGRASQIRTTPFSGESTDSSDHESDSGKIDDYLKPIDSDVPPDNSEDTMQRINEEKEKVLKTCAAYTTVSLKKGDQRKEGFLTKLGGRIKNWKKRWFVLEDGKLYYYKNPADVGRKPLGQVPLDGSCRISRTEGALTIEVATTNRTYYLTGETLEEVGEWLRVLHNVMRKFTTSPLLAQMPEKEVMSGWVTKVKNGLSKRSWCVLRGKYLCYYKNQNDSVPFSMANLMDIVVEELETQDSDEEKEHLINSYRHFTLVLKGEKQSSPTYLLIDTKAEKDLWLFHLIVSSGSGLGNKGTEFEKIASKLVSMDGDPESELWNTPLLTFSKEAIVKPLTTLPSVELEQEAIKLFKSILLFTTVATDEAAIDYHVSLAQNALQIVLDHPELQNEIYCMLVKQTSKHIHRGAEDLGHFLMNCSGNTRSWLRDDACAMGETIDLRPVQEFVYLQSWQLLALCTSLFVPKQELLSFVKLHLKRSINLKTRQGKYAAYCVRSLERTIANGKREARPSRMEILSVLLQNPYDHICHMNLAVHFMDGKAHVFGFDGSTSVGEFIETINSSLGIRGSSESGYAIFTDNPVSPIEHCLQTSVKLCDVMSKWEQAMRSNCKGRLDSSRIIRLSYKNRLYFKSLQENETPKEKYFLVFQTNINVVKGRFPVSKDMAIEFAALMAQIQYGDYRAHSNSLPSKRIETVISRHFPKHIRECSDSEKRSLTLKMAEKWSTFHGWSVQESVDKYLENAKRWPFFGSKLFKAKQRETTSSTKRRPSSAANTQPVWLAVEEDSVSILEGETLRLMCRYKYKHVVTFGGCKDDFMLVVNQSIMRGGSTVEQGTQRLLFNMARGKILEITLLMASYINAIVKQQGITCDLPPLSSHSSKASLEMKVWDLESAEWPIVPGSNVGLL